MFFRESFLFYAKIEKLKKHAHNSVKVDITFTAIGLFQKPDEAEFQKLIQTVKDNPAEYKQISA